MRPFLYFLCVFFSLPATAQIWDTKDISFPVPSQGWRVRPVDDKVATTFGYSIAPDSIGYQFTNEEKTIQRTMDGGETWQSISFKDIQGDGGFICDVVGIDGNNLFVSYFDNTDGPILYKTFDGGVTWSKDNAGITYFLNWVSFFDKSNGIGFGDPNDSGLFEIIYTSDGGHTWQTRDSTQSIMSIATDEYGQSGEFTTKGDHVWTRTNYNRILHSSDQGITWEVIMIPTGAGGQLGIQADDSLNLYAGFSDFDNNTFTIFKKGIDNDEWIEITPTDNIGYITGFKPIPSSKVLLLDSGIYQDPSTFKTWASTDGGISWAVVAANEGLQYGYVEFYSPTTGYACEIPRSFELPTTKVFKFNGSPISGILNQNKLDVAVSIFPNPASNMLNVEVSTEKIADYWIIINDINGGLIEKQIITNQGSFNTSMTIADLPIGEYSVTISTKDGLVSKKFTKF